MSDWKVLLLLLLVVVVVGGGGGVSVLGFYYYYCYYYSYSCSYPYPYSYAYSSDSSTPVPSSQSATLVVPVADDAAYSITVVYKYSSQDAHGTDRLVLIGYAFHWLFKHALATQAVSDLRLCLRLFFSEASTYVHVNLPWGNLSPLSTSMQRSAVKTEAHT